MEKKPLTKEFSMRLRSISPICKVPESKIDLIGELAEKQPVKEEDDWCCQDWVLDVLKTLEGGREIYTERTKITRQTKSNPPRKKGRSDGCEGTTVEYYYAVVGAVENPFISHH